MNGIWEALHIAVGVRTGVEDQIQYRNPMLKSTERLGIFRIAAVIHISQFHVGVSEALIHNIIFGSRAGKISIAACRKAQIHQTLRFSLA